MDGFLRGPARHGPSAPPRYEDGFEKEKEKHGECISNGLEANAYSFLQGVDLSYRVVSCRSF